MGNRERRGIGKEAVIGIQLNEQRIGKLPLLFACTYCIEIVQVYQPK